MKIVINSSSSGKFSERTINGRPHLVTSMVSIEGDTVMNRLFYPNAEVVSSYAQLDGLLAPASHPLVDGRHAVAAHPLAVNAHNTGAFVVGAKLDGKRVVNELALDLEVSRRDPRGVEVERRIRAGERIPVSTGLNATRVDTVGQHNGDAYDGTLSGLMFDHVAILLDEEPAGKTTFTQNSETVLICNLKEKGSITTESHDNDGFKPTHASEKAAMDIKQLLAFMVANAAFNLSAKDITRLADMPEADLAETLANSVSVVVTEDMARETLTANGLTVNAADFDATGYADFVANLDSFGEFKTAKAADRAKTVASIIANSEMVAEDLADFDDAKLVKLLNSLKPAQDYSGGAQPVGMSNREGGTDEGVSY